MYHFAGCTFGHESTDCVVCSANYEDSIHAILE